MLLGHVLRKPRWWILAQGDHRLDRSEYQEFCALISRRAEGEPVAYLRERVEWADLELKVTPDVLIPRPETELLVDRAVQLARRRGATVLADIGTGSGAISIRLARCLPETQVFAVDVSTKALSVAKTNVQTYHVEHRVHLLAGHLAEPLFQTPHLIVANLPYLSDAMMDDLDDDVRHEPRLALHAGTTGLELYAELFGQLRGRGRAPALALEIDSRQGEDIGPLIQTYFPAASVDIAKDYAGMDRTVLVSP